MMELRNSLVGVKTTRGVKFSRSEMKFDFSFQEQT